MARLYSLEDFQISLRMKVLLLLLWGVATILTASIENEEKSLSAEIEAASARVLRSADPGRKKSAKTGSKKGKKNKGKKQLEKKGKKKKQSKGRKGLKKGGNKKGKKNLKKKGKKNLKKKGKKNMKKKGKKNLKKKGKKNMKKKGKKSGQKKGNKRKGNKGKKSLKNKGKKNQKKSKGKKGNKNSRKRSRNNKRKNGKRSKGIKRKASGRSVDGDCIENAVTAMKRWRDVVANFEKQYSRIEKQSAIASKKSDKKGVFAPIALKLVDLGGGNKSAPSCAGSTESDGAKQLANLTKTLFDCEKEVHASCHPENFPAPNATQVTECKDAVNTFKTETKKCIDLSKSATASDACSCWTSSNYTSVSDAVKSCKISEVGNVAKGLKACTAAFSKCRKFEDDVIDAFSSCSKSVSELKQKAAALSKNKDALTDVKAKVAKATGSSSRRRFAREAATDCASFIVLVVQCK